MSKPNINNVPSYTVEDAFNAADAASDLVNQYVVSPLANLGIGGFVFDVEDETDIELDNDITDHYSENNTAIQDNVAVRPDQITLRGYVGELVWRAQKNNSTLVQLTQKITTIASYLPTITSAAKQAYSALTAQGQTNSQYFSNSLNNSIDLYNSFKTLNPPKTKQAQAFNYFRALRNARTKLSIDTPYTFYPNMVVEKLRATQSGQSKYISDFTVVLKQIRTVSTKTVKFDPKKYQGRASAQISDTVNQGKVNGSKLSASQQESIFSKLKGQVSSFFK